MSQNYEFQQKTIDAACAHFKGHTRVLCADEAGLGKTYVARGVLERLAEEKLEEEAAKDYDYDKDKKGAHLQAWWSNFCDANKDAFISTEKTLNDNRWKIVSKFLCRLVSEDKQTEILYSETNSGDKRPKRLAGRGSDHEGGLMPALKNIDWWDVSGAVSESDPAKQKKIWIAFYKKFVKRLHKLLIVMNGGKRFPKWEFTLPPKDNDNDKDKDENEYTALPAEPFRVLYVCCNLDIAKQNTTRLVPTRQNSSRSRDDKPDRLSTLWYYIENYPTPYLEIMPITATLASRDTQGSKHEVRILRQLPSTGEEGTEENSNSACNAYADDLLKLDTIVHLRDKGEDRTGEKYKPDLIIFDEFQNFGQIMNTANGTLSSFANSGKTDLERVSAFCRKYIGMTPNQDKTKILMLSATPFHLPAANTASSPQQRVSQLQMADIITFMGGDPAAYDALATAADRANYLYDTCGIFRTERIRLMGKDNAAYHLLSCDGAKLLRFGAYLRGNGQGNVASRAAITTPHLDRVPTEYKNCGTYNINPDLKLSPNEHPRYQRLRDVVVADDANDVTEKSAPGRLRKPDVVKKLLWIPPVKPSHALGGVFARYKEYSKTLVFSDLAVTPRSVTDLLNEEISYTAVSNIKREDLEPLLEKYLRENGLNELAAPKKDSGGSGKPSPAEQLAGPLADYLLAHGGSAFADFTNAEDILQYCKDGCLADVLKELAALQDLPSPKKDDPQDDDDPKKDIDLIQLLEDYITDAAGADHGRFAVAMNAATTGKCRDAFNTPFLPFVLMTTSIGTEGLDFHLYCNRLAHYTCPSSIVELEQKNGRIDRRRSLAQRRWWATPGAKFRLEHYKDEMTQRSGGLVPDWDAGENNLHYYFFYFEHTQAYLDLKKLFTEQDTYRRALGVNKDLLPELMNLSPYLRRK